MYYFCLRDETIFLLKILWADLRYVVVGHFAETASLNATLTCFLSVKYMGSPCFG